VVIKAFSVSDIATYKSDVEKGNNLMLTRLSPVATLSRAVGYAVGRKTIAVLGYAYMYSSKHIFGLCIIL